MKTYLRTILAAAAVMAAVLAPPGESAAAPQRAPLTAAERGELERVERYLNEVRTMQSRFVQVNPDGRQVAGTFYLARPGRMRLEYDPPIRDFIVADGLMLFYWDGEMRQQSSTPIGSTLADFILRRNIALSGDVTVTDVLAAPGVLEVSLVETKDPGKGVLTLVFEDRPLNLRKWRVLDAQGLVTEVGLLNPRVGVPLDRNLFYFAVPEADRRGFRH
ncbi:LolA family protein [Azospirillum halopraeferens]|uniref:LolA family protein n=1 Tax=Azospirillum halopraeferens TaxID=34010 RepID=UPI00040F5A50|nr:outer membrane lipoprotein carrier protein LolA [Azospirillum halopraeferens]